MSANPSSPANASGPAPGRLMSIDALRGCDMFWIVGGEEIIHALHKISHTGFVNALAGQMDHKPWEGVAFYDLIFPLFVFIVGVSLVFSLSKTMEQAGRRTAYRRILVRSLLLYLIGLVYYKGITNGFDHVRLLGVLQRIAICYLCAGLVFCTFKLRGMIVTFLALLIGYWALMTFVPIRQISLEKKELANLAIAAGTTNTVVLFNSATNRVSGHFEEGFNLANHLDFQYLPGRKWDGAYDPEGLLSTLPAIGTCLFGVFAGLLLRSKTTPDPKKVRLLLIGGVNAIALYLAHEFIDFRDLAKRLVGGPVQAGFGAYGELLVAAVVIAMTFLIVNFLYRRKIFLRL